jgi:malonyl-CoA decarboxylase
LTEDLRRRGIVMRPSDLGIDTTTAMRDLLAARSLDDLAKPRLPRWPKSETDEWWRDAARSEVLRPWLMRHCATYLTRPASSKPRIDPVARFHLGNGARLERINWLGNAAPRGIEESFGIMVNYLYDPGSIEANHETFAHDGTVVRSPDVDALMRAPQRR